MSCCRRSKRVVPRDILTDQRDSAPGEQRCSPGAFFSMTGMPFVCGESSRGA